MDERVKIPSAGEAFIDMIETFMGMTREEQETYLRVLKGMAAPDDA